MPFVFVQRLSPAALAYANALASGLMLGASFGLVSEGTVYGSVQTVVGAVVGVLFIMGTQAALHRQDLAFGQARGQGARKMLLVMIVMTVHSAAEGIAVGVSFGGGMTLAFAIVIAIAVHNIPEGIAISAVMRPQGVSVAGGASWSIVSSLPQPLLAVPAFLMVGAFARALPYGIGFAAGAMVFMVLEELLPEAYERARKLRVALLVSVSLLGMVFLQRFL